MERTLSAESVVVASKEQVSCELSGEAAILNLTSGVYYGLDPVGARVWSLLQEPRLVGAIRDALTAEYDVDANGCERDLVALLRDLAAARLIEVRDAPTR